MERCEVGKEFPIPVSESQLEKASVGPYQKMGSTGAKRKRTK